MTNDRQYTSLEELRDLAHAKLGELVERYPEAGPAALLVAGLMRVRFNGRFLNRMGDANLATFEIRLASKLWPKVTPEQRVNTLTHEIAHLVTFALDPRAPGHGSLWRRVHKLMGGDGQERCTYAIEWGDLRPGRWACGCAVHAVTLQKHRAMVKKWRRGARYVCRECGQGLDCLNPDYKIGS